MILPETVSSTSAWSSPCLFPTKHWYIPLSECVRPLIVKLPLLKWYRSVSFTGLPLKYHLYCKTGNPKAMHGRTTDECETDVVSCGFVTHSGLAREMIINNIIPLATERFLLRWLVERVQTMEVTWRWRNFFFSYSDAKKEVKKQTNKQTNKKKIDKHFPWFVFLWIIEMTSKCSKLKWNHRPQATLTFHCNDGGLFVRRTWVVAGRANVLPSVVRSKAVDNQPVDISRCCSQGHVCTFLL